MNDINSIEFANFLKKPFIFLDKNGVIVAKNDFYNNLTTKIEDFEQMKGSIFDSLILSSDQKTNLKQGNRVSADYILSLKTGTLTKVFPRKRLVDRMFLNMTFIPLIKKGIIYGYTLVITDNSDSFNDGIDIRERKLMWEKISVLGKMAYLQYDINADEWMFSDNWRQLFKMVGNESSALSGTQEGSRVMDMYLSHLAPKDRKMIQEQWGLSLVDSRPEDVFEYTYEVDLNGEKRYHSTRWTLDNDPANPSVYGVIMDITELTKTEHALSDSLAQMSLLSSLESLVLWNLDVNSRTVIVNKEISDDGILDEFSLLEDSIPLDEILMIAHPEDLEELKKHYFSSISGKNSSTNIKTRFKNQNDNYIFVSTNFVVQRVDENGEPLIIMGLTKVEREKDDDAQKHKTMDEKRTILIAEDIDNNYDLLNIILRKDYNLVRAVNGVEAVKLFSEVHPDIILMDMKMPEMGGLEATRLIRMESQDVPVIAVTAFAFESDREVAIEAGCNDFLSKPIDIPVLKALIKKYLAR